MWSNFNKLCPLWTISDESPNKGQYGVTLINCAPCGQLVMNHLIRRQECFDWCLCFSVTVHLSDKIANVYCIFIQHPG